MSQAKNKNHLIFALTACFLIFALSCSSTKKAVKFNKKGIQANSSIAVVIDSKSNLKNVVLVKFLAKGFNVKAFNATDMYQMSDIYDIKDLKKLSYSSTADEASSLLSMQKSYSNLYKLHFYNYEISKAELLTEIKGKWGVDYLVVLDLKDWEEVSWGRVIDLRTYDIVWLENYPNQYGDNIETIMDHFIESMIGK